MARRFSFSQPWYVAWLCLALASCDLAPLTSEDLFGPQDAGARPVEDGLGPQDAGPSVVEDGLAPDLCEGCFGALSGTVVDGCTMSPLGAVVGIAGIRQCSSSAKGGYFFAGIPSGISLTLAAGKPGYRSWSTAITVEPSGTARIEIVLIPASPFSCENPPPQSPCVCSEPGCI